MAFSRKSSGGRRAGRYVIPFLLLSVIWITGCVSRTKDAASPLVIACGDLNAGMLLSSFVLEDVRISDAGTDFIAFTDCCGSQAQFAISTGEIDMAILCPDAARSLLASGEDYIELGPVVYDGNVLVSRPEDSGAPRTIGFMNQREDQSRLLEDYFGSAVRLVPMFPSALGYALESGAADAVMMDAINALKLGYPMRSISKNAVTSVLLVRRDRLDSPDVQAFIAAYNECIADLNDKKTEKMLQGYLNLEHGKKEVEAWKALAVRFAPLTTEIS